MDQPQMPHHAFTITYSRIMRELVTPAVAANYFSPSSYLNVKNALWDTGATGTGINISLAHKLGLVL